MRKNIHTISQAKNELENSFNRYEFCRTDFVRLISEKTDFEIDIIWQLGDGFTVLDVKSGLYVAPLDICIEIIEEKGILTHEDFMNQCI